MPTYSQDIEIMISAVHTAAKAIRRDFYEIAGLQNSYSFSAITKFAGVSHSKVYKIISEQLYEYKPYIGFSDKEGTEYYWRITPIDGIYNFSRSIPYFAVSLTLFKVNEPIAVVMEIPTSDEIFWAERGVGAYLEDPNIATKLRLSNRRDTNNSVIGLHKINGKIFRALEGMRYRIVGSTDVNLAYVAASKIDVVLFAKETTDNTLLIKEAMGKVLYTDDYCIAGQSNIVATLAKRISDNESGN